MFKRIFWITVINFVLISPSYALTLDDTITATIQKNPDILTTVKDHYAITEALKQARAPYYPHLRVNLGYGADKNVNSDTIGTGSTAPTMPKREEGVLISQMLFDGFATKNDVARNTARVNSAIYKVIASMQDTVQRNIEVYTGVLREQELVVLAQQNLEFHEKIMRMIKLRTERGISRLADQYQAEARLSLARSNVLAELSNLGDAKANFYRTTGLAPDALAPPPQADMRFVPKTQQQALDIAIKNNPVVRSANADIVAAIEQHQVANATNFPRFDLQVGLSRDRNVGGVRGPSFDQYAMVRMTYDLFNGGADVGKQRETAYEAQEAAEIKDHAVRQLIEAVKLTWDLYVTARDQLPMLRTHVTSSIKTVRAYAEQYQIGQRTLLDLLDSQNELFSAKRSLVSGRYDYETAKYRLLRDIGISIVALHLEHDITDNTYTDAANNIDLNPERNSLDKTHYGLSIQAAKGDGTAKQYLDSARLKALHDGIDTTSENLPDYRSPPEAPAATRSYDVAPPVSPPSGQTPAGTIAPGFVPPQSPLPNATPMAPSKNQLPPVAPAITPPPNPLPPVTPAVPIQNSNQGRPVVPLAKVTANPVTKVAATHNRSFARPLHPRDELMMQMAEINKQPQAAMHQTKVTASSTRTMVARKNSPVIHATHAKLTGWFIQVGCFKDKENVKRVIAKLQAAKFSVVRKEVRTARGALTYVYVGPQTLPSARLLARQMEKRTQLHGFLVQV